MFISSSVAVRVFTTDSKDIPQYGVKFYQDIIEIGITSLIIISMSYKAELTPLGILQQLKALVIRTTQQQMKYE